MKTPLASIAVMLLLLTAASAAAPAPVAPDPAARLAAARKIAGTVKYQKGDITLNGGVAKISIPEAFRYVDYTLPLVFAKAAHGAGVETFALVSAIGAATNSMSFYARTKGEVERDIQQIGFRSLTICRPSIIAGKRSETRIAEGTVLAISRALAPILPKKFHVNPAPVIAASLLDSVLTARPGCRWVFAEELN